MTPPLVKILVKNILEKATEYKWTYQGLGMLRLNLTDSIRLHVWDPDRAVPGVTQVHTHPWSFKSYVISGHVLNTTYHKNKSGLGEVYYEQKIICGPGGGVTGPPEEWNLYRAGYSNVKEGEMYDSTSYTIHRSQPDPGTVTIIDRSFTGSRDEAYVYYPQTTEWVSAESRPARADEILSFTELALSKML